MKKEITFFIQENSDDDFIAQQGTLADLLLKIHFFICPRTKFIPPDFLIIERLKESMFQSGAYDIKWQSNDMDLSMENLAHTNQILINKGYIKPSLPNWVVGKLSWNAFTLEVFKGIPHTEYIPMAKQREKLSQQLAELGEVRNAQYFEIYDQLRKVLDEEMALMDRYPIKTPYLFEGENP